MTISDTHASAAARASTLALTLCACAALLEGFDNQSLGVAAPRLFPEFGLSSAQGSLLFSATTVGLAFGAVIGGRLADRSGRKLALVLSLLLFGASSFATALGTHLSQLFVARALTGLGLGGAMPNSIAISSEAVAPQRRLRVVSTVTAALPLGGAIAGLLALGQSRGWPWRSIFYVGGVAPLLLALACWRWLPSSPLSVREPRQRTAPRPAVAALFGGVHLSITLQLWMGFFFMHLLLLLLLNWLPTLFIGFGFTRTQASWSAVAFNVCGAFIGAALARLQSGNQRRRWVLFTYLGMAVALAALSQLGHSFPRAILACACAGSFVIGGQLILYALAPVCYPYSVRGTGVGAAVAIGRVGSIVGPLYAGALLSLGAGSMTVLLATLPFVLLSGGAAFALTRRGDSLDAELNAPH